MLALAYAYYDSHRRTLTLAWPVPGGNDGERSFIVKEDANYLPFIQMDRAVRRLYGAILVTYA